MGTGGPFPGGKARPGRDADHSPPSSAEVVNESEVYLLCPQAPPLLVEGLLYFFFLQKCWRWISDMILISVYFIELVYNIATCSRQKKYFLQFRFTFWTVYSKIQD